MENRKYAVKLTTNMSAMIVEKPEDQSMLDFCYQHCNCDMIEAVNPRGLDDPYMFVCDEEYLFKDHPVINFVASYLYETHKHKHPICGDVVVMRYGYDDFEMLTLEEAEKMRDKLRKMSFKSFNEVSNAMADRLIAQ